jgi:hypothetical protein
MAHAKARPSNVQPGRYKPEDELLAFLKALVMPHIQTSIYYPIIVAKPGEPALPGIIGLAA